MLLSGLRRLAPASPTLLRILIASTVNRLGSFIGLVALSIAVFDHTHSALAVSALLLAWQGLPAFAVPALIVRVEASTHGHELAGLYLSEALATSAIVVVLAHFWLPGILILAFVDGTAALVSSSLLRTEAGRCGRRDLIDPCTAEGPAREAALAGGQERANEWMGLALAAAFVAGPVLGGLLTAGLGASNALIVDATSFAVVALVLVDRHPHVAESAGNTMRASLREARRHIRTLPALRTLLIGMTLVLPFIGTAGPIEVVYAKVTLGAGDHGYGVLLGAQGAGGLVATLIYRQARTARRITLVCVGVVAQALAFLGCSVAPSLLVACLASFVCGLGNFLEVPALMSLVQRLTPAALQGRLTGKVESLTSACVSGGVVLGGALVAGASARTAFGVAGLSVLATSTIFVWLALRWERLAPASDPGGGASLAHPSPLGAPDWRSAAADATDTSGTCTPCISDTSH